MRKKGNLLSSFFEFTADEMKGIGICMAIICVLIAYQYFPIFNVLPPEIQILNLGDLDSGMVELKQNSNSKEQQAKWNLHTFNPNGTKAVEFREMGFSRHFISAFFAHRSQNGYVKTADEFFAIYAFSETERIKIQPFLTFDWGNRSFEKSTKDYEVQSTPSTQKAKQKLNLVIDVNHADSVEFQQIYGVGPVLSGRIVKYRNKLGGFYAMHQLWEVYGLDSSVLQQAQLTLNGFGAKSVLKINQLDAKGLSQHPYVNYALAKRIVAYRTQHGAFNTTNDLLNVYGVDQNWLNKMGGYLDFGK